MAGEKGGGGRYVVEEDPPATMSRRTFVKAGAVAAAIAWMGAFGVNIPLFRNKLKAAETEAALNLEARREMLADVKNDTFFRINEIFHEIQTAEELLKIYEFSLIPQAELSLKSSEIGYLAGKVGFLHLLESERMILQLRLGYFQILSGLGKSLALLERIVGFELE